MENKNIQDIQAPGSEDIYAVGAGGGGKGGGSARPAQEADNTLRSSAIVRVVEVISEGQIEGIAGGAKGIYINDTPLQNGDGSYNFQSVEWDYRVGLPDQDYLPGFSSIESEINVATQVSIANNNITRTVSSGNVDAVRVTIQLPQGLSFQDTSNGDLVGYSVSFRIDKKLTSSSTWITSGAYTISGKSTTPYEVQYRIDRPAGSGTWDVRVVRLSADAPTSNIRDVTNFQRLTEIQEIKLEYNDTALVGIALDAEAFGNTVPKRAYLVKGVRVQIPSNYNPETRVYTGVWDGTFTTAWTDNPAWVLYDMLTNERYGMGEFITETDIDKFSFYDAAVYNDELVDDGNGGFEPRYTFNGRIAAQDEFLRIAQMVAGSMRANLVYVNNKYILIQDRPASSVMVINKTNVVDGLFRRKSSSRQERHTAFNVAWNDRNDRHLQRVSTVEDTDGINRYGYYPIDIAAYGATTEGQAIRAGRWAMYTELNQVQQVSFDMSFEGFSLLPGDIVTIMDDDWANVQQAGRTASATSTTTVVLDRPVTLTAGSTITVNLPDGSGPETRNIVQTSGSLSTITISSAFSQTIPAQSVFMVQTSNAAGKEYKIINLKQGGINTVTVECVEHDANKYAFVETGVSIPAPVFSNAIRTVVLPPTSLVFEEETVVLPNRQNQRSLRVSWTPPSGSVRGYQIYYSRDNGNRASVFVEVNSVTIPAEADGLYNIAVFTRDFNGNVSGTSLDGTYLIDSTTGGALSAPQNLYVKGTTGTNFTQSDLVITWTQNSADTLPAKEYKVEVYTTADVLLRVANVDADVAEYRYSLDQNIADGGPRGSVKIKVYSRDASNRYGPAATATFTNPVPANVAGLTVAGSFKNNFLKWSANTENDIVGYLVWRGTTAGFTPSSANLVFEGMATSHTDSGLPDSTTYYYKVAAYDIFSRNVNGTGLNIVTSAAITTLDPAETNEYQVTGVTWKPNDPATNSVSWTACTVIKTGGASSGTTWSITAGNAAWTSGILYVYYTEGETIFRTTTVLANAIGASKIIVATYRGGTNLEIGDGKAFTDGSLIIAGTIGAAQLTVGTAVITESAQIANAIVTNAKIADATIDNAKIANATITGAKIANATIATGNIIDANITNAKIQDGAISTAKIGDAQITSAKIGDAQITTAKIGDAQITGAKIVDATITGAKIANATIGTANIGDAQITTAKIGNLAVDTLQIANNAVIIPVAAYTAGKITITANPQNLQSLNITIPSTAPNTSVIISVSSLIAVGYNTPYYDDPRTPPTATAQILRNGVLLYSVSVNSPFGESFVRDSTTIVDSPGVGTHNYTYRITQTFVPFDVRTTVTSPSLVLLGAKK